MGMIIASRASVGLMIFSFAIPRLGLVLGPFYAAAGSLAFWASSGRSELSPDGRDRVLDEALWILSSLLGLVMTALSIWRLILAGPVW